jgi:hypothetical protein
MRLFDQSYTARIPLGDAIIYTTFGKRVHTLKPGTVATNLPLAVYLHDSTQLAIRSGMKIMTRRQSRRGGPEVNMAISVHRIFQLALTQCTLEGWKEMSDRLSIVPHMGTTTRTAASITKAAFPAPQIAILVAQDCGRL